MITNEPTMLTLHPTSDPTQLTLDPTKSVCIIYVFVLYILFWKNI